MSSSQKAVINGLFVCTTVWEARKEKLEGYKYEGQKFSGEPGGHLLGTLKTTEGFLFNVYTFVHGGTPCLGSMTGFVHGITWQGLGESGSFLELVLLECNHYPLSTSNQESKKDKANAGNPDSSQMNHCDFPPSSFPPFHLSSFPSNKYSLKNYLFVCFGSCCSTQDLSLWHESSVTLWLTCQILAPWPGIKHRSPALQGGFLTTGPPGRSPNQYSWTIIMFQVLTKWRIWRRNVHLLNTSVVLDIVCTSLQLIITVQLGDNYYTTQYCRGRNRDPLRLNDLPKSQVKVKVAQSCPALYNPMDYTVHGILQARILEWLAFPFSRGSSQPSDQTQVSWFAGGFLPQRKPISD